METGLSNPKILTETGRATKALVSASDNLSKVVLSVSAFAQEVNDIVEQIDIKQGELSQLDTIYADKLRQHKIDLNFKIQENESAELDGLLNSRGLVAVSANTVDGLEKQINDLTVGQEKAIASEVAKAKSVLTAEHANAIKIKDLEHANATAKVNAELDSANAKIKYLEDALETANKALDAERAARIEIASKTSQPTINVNGK